MWWVWGLGVEDDFGWCIGIYFDFDFLFIEFFVLGDEGVFVCW